MPKMLKIYVSFPSLQNAATFNILHLISYKYGRILQCDIIAYMTKMLKISNIAACCKVEKKKITLSSPRRSNQTRLPPDPALDTCVKETYVSVKETYVGVKETYCKCTRTHTRLPPDPALLTCVLGV